MWFPQALFAGGLGTTLLRLYLRVFNHFIVFGDLSKCRFWHDLRDYSILLGVHGMQEVVGSNPIGSIAHIFILPAQALI